MKKMKRGLLILPLIVPLFVVGLSSCDVERGELLEIEYVSGLKETYIRYATVDFNEVKVKAVFENGVLDLLGSKLTFDPLELYTEEIGDYNLTISYSEKSLIWPYKVVEFDEIENVELPQEIATYKANIKEKTNKRSEFMDREQGYHVGTDNPWKFLPVIHAYDDDDEEIEVTAYRSSSKVYEKRGSEYVLLSGNDLTSIVTIDEYRSTYHFTSEAHGKTYRLYVHPYGEKYAEHEIDFEFQVTSGYNVTKQDDLLHFDNYNNGKWDSYRALKNITHVNINGLILHNDIKLKAENVADGFKYLEGDSDVKAIDADFDYIFGSLRDNNDLYHRNIMADEEFIFNGNYFNIDYTSLPYVVRQGGTYYSEPGNIISHFSIFRVSGPDETAGYFTMKNLSATGNANRTEEGIKSGGGIFIKVSKSDIHFYNNIVTQTFVILIGENNTVKVLIEKSRGYDSFSSLLYCWGTNDYVIKDSEFIGAGGPVIIADHVGPGDDGKSGNFSNVKIYNSKLESWVFGIENWFKLVHADAIAPTLVNFGVYLSQFGSNAIVRGQKRGEITDHKFNLIAVFKGDKERPTSDIIQGTFQVDDGDYGLNFNNAFMNSVSWVDVKAPRLQSSGGQAGVVIEDGDKNLMLVNESFIPVQPYLETNQNYFSGDYLNVYYNIGSGDGFMGLVFGLTEYVVDQ